MGFVDSLFSEALFRTGPKLKLVQLLPAGYEKGDLEAARRAGVPLANIGGANSVAVPKHAFMLAVPRELISQHANLVTGRWRGNALPWVFELHGKALGIVGLETIGKESVRLAQAFCVEAIYYIERPDENIEDRLSVRFQLFRNFFAWPTCLACIPPYTRRLAT